MRLVTGSAFFLRFGGSCIKGGDWSKLRKERENYDCLFFGEICANRVRHSLLEDVISVSVGEFIMGQKVVELRLDCHY